MSNSQSKRDSAASEREESDKRDLAIDEVLDDVQTDSNANETETDELTQARQDARKAQDRLVRAQAELENVRKRMRREQEEERRYASMPLIRDLLPVIDNLQRAMTSVDTSECPPGLADGVQMVTAQIFDVLSQHHCMRVDPIGEPFDPMQHEAVGQQPSAEYAQGVVSEVVQVGYKLHDRVVRPSHVIVSQGPPTS